MKSPPPISARAPETFFPTGYEDLLEGDPARPRFMLRASTLLERTRVFTDLVAEGFRYPGDRELRASIREMLESAGEESRAPWLALLDEVDLMEKEEGFEGLEPESEHSKGMNELTEMARAYHPPFRALVAERMAYNSALPLLLFRKFCTGWSGYQTRYAKSLGLVDEAAIDALIAEGVAAGKGNKHVQDIVAAGTRLSAMLSPKGPDLKNSAAPSRSPSGDGTSTANPETAGNGKSPEAGSPAT